MKKILLFVVVLLLAIPISACTTGESAEQATSNALKAIQQMDKETMIKYLDVDDLLGVEGEDSDSDTLDTDEIIVIFESIKYKINSSKEDGDSAVVNVDITNIDMENVFGKFIQEAFTFAFSNAFSSDSLSDEETDAKMTEMLLEIIEENKESTVTTNVDIKLNKVEKSWKIDLEDTLLNALMGNFFDAAEALDGDFSDSEEPEEDANIIRKALGDNVEFTTISFKVTGVNELQSLKPKYGDPLKAEEGTKFIVVDVEIMNITKEEITFESNFELVDNEDRRFNPFSDALMYVDDDINYRGLSPSIKEKGKIVYLVPDTSTQYYITSGKAGTNDVFEIVLK